MRPAWIEIKIDALRKNIRNLQNSAAKGADFMAVIKADGYGHGVLKLAEILQEEGVKRFAVAMVEEALELRENGFDESILVLGKTPKEDYSKLIDYKLTPTVYRYTQAVSLNETAEEFDEVIPIHIKVDTGMGRLGFMPDEAVENIIKIMKLSNLEIEGIFSHLATADRAPRKGYII